MEPLMLTRGRGLVLGLGLLLASAGFIGSWIRSGEFHPVIYDDVHAKNVLFDSDPARVVQTMSNRETPFQRFSLTHPLHSALTYPAVFTVRHLLRIEPLVAVRLVGAGIAALWAATLFTVLLLMGCRRQDAVLFTLLGLWSSAGMFWLAIPETYGLGSLTILCAVGLGALAARHQVRDAWFVGISALSLSATVTNWMAGLSVTAVSRRWQRAVQISMNALALVVLAWVVQRKFFPASRFFLEPTVDRRFLIAPEAGGFLVVLKGFFLDSVILPAVSLVREANAQWFMPVLSVQHSPPGAGSWIGTAGVAALVALLVLAIWSLVRPGAPRSFRLALGLILLGQLGLHLVFGVETFLYALNFAPLLIVAAATGTLTRLRIPILALTAIVALCAAISNTRQFQRTVELSRTRASDAFAVDSAARVRPGDPFPRGVGRVILAIPGSQGSEKGYHEPGGGFSPAPRSFGVAVWVRDSTGRDVASSGAVPIALVSQRFDWSERTHGPPDIVTETPYYRLRWSAAGEGRWRVSVQAVPSTGLAYELVIRSAGPTGGPISSLRWNGRGLEINNQWTVTPDTPQTVVLGHEGDAGWKSARAGLNSWSGADGWGFARFTVTPGSEWKAAIERKGITWDVTKPGQITRSAVRLDLPDARFAASLEAQVAHLMMGMVGTEVRRGDPLTFSKPLVGEADLIPTALARAGLFDVAAMVSGNSGQGSTTATAPGPDSSRAALVARARAALHRGRLDSTWTVLARFWDEQDSRGLYAWPDLTDSTGSDEQWERLRTKLIRGWFRPSYDVAAQVLLLQLDMLGFEEESGPTPHLVLGGGVPPSWIGRRMTVRNLPVTGGTLDWDWDGKTLRIRSDSPYPVRLGPAFPPNTTVIRARPAVSR